MNHEALYEKSSPIRLFFIVGLPSIISMLMSSLYMVIDGVFVGQIIGSQALAALNIVLPLVILCFALSDLVGVGSSVPIAIHLGEKNYKTANEIFSLSCILIIVTGFITGGILLLFAEKFMIYMGADGELLSLCKQYLIPYALLSPFISIFFAVDNFLRICGKVKYSMWVNISMAVEGIILEWLFLRVLGWGIWAAALAFCLSMVISTIIAFYPFFRKKLILQFVRPKGSLKLIGNIIASGSPALLSNISGRVVSILINSYLLRQGGDLAVAAYSVMLYIEGIVYSVIYGLNDSLQPAIGYNYGAKNNKRIKDIMKILYSASFIISIAITAWLLLGGEHAILLFVKAEEVALVQLSLHAIKLFSITFAFRWFTSVTGTYFTAINRPGYAISITTSMSFLFPILLLLFLPSWLGLDKIWLTMPIATILASILTICFLIYEKYKKKHFYLKNKTT